MKSLNTSLPRSYPRRQPPSDLHQAFKAAALSVAQLYKTAATDEDNARAVGYQDALEELLSFMDQENLGVQDGEGWRVRQWVTERLSPDAYGTGDEDGEESRPEQAASSKPKETTTQAAQQYRESERLRSSSAPVVDRQAQPQQSPQKQENPALQSNVQTSSRPEIFHFRSALQPSEDATMANNDKTPERPTATNSRHFRSRSHAHGLRESTSAAALASLGLGAGAKRKSSPNDTFDLNIFDNLKDGFGGGGKRGRFA